MVKFVADLGSNHNQDFNRAVALLKAAKEAGCWGAKIQLFRANKLYAPQHVPRDTKKSEIPMWWLQKLYYQAHDIGLHFGGTPFDLDAVRILQPYVDYFKISSFDILRLNLIDRCCAYGKPIMIATGMADGPEIYQATKICDAREVMPTFLHCISRYPAMPKECELKKMMKLPSSALGVGWSDHTAMPGVIYRAVGLGAGVIEFHLDLGDGMGREFGYGHCWTPEEIKEVITNIQLGDIAETINVEPTYDLREARSLRADPSDGLRPMRHVRK